MKEKFMALPEALQKQLIIRFGAGSVFFNSHHSNPCFV